MLLSIKVNKSVHRVILGKDNWSEISFQVVKYCCIWLVGQASNKLKVWISDDLKHQFLQIRCFPHIYLTWAVGPSIFSDPFQHFFVLFSNRIAYWRSCLFLYVFFVFLQHSNWTLRLQLLTNTKNVATYCLWPWWLLPKLISCAQTLLSCSNYLVRFPVFV